MISKITPKQTACCHAGIAMLFRNTSVTSNGLPCFRNTLRLAHTPVAATGATCRARRYSGWRTSIFRYSIGKRTTVGSLNNISASGREPRRESPRHAPRKSRGITRLCANTSTRSLLRSSTSRTMASSPRRKPSSRRSSVLGNCASCFSRSKLKSATCALSRAVNEPREVSHACNGCGCGGGAARHASSFNRRSVLMFSGSAGANRASVRDAFRHSAAPV